MAQLPPPEAVAFRLAFSPTAIILRRWRSPIRMAAYSWHRPNMDVQDMQARFMFGKEKEVTLPDGERLGESDEPRSRSGFSRAGHGLGSALHHGRGLGRGLGHGADGVKAIPVAWWGVTTPDA